MSTATRTEARETMRDYYVELLQHEEVTLDTENGDEESSGGGGGGGQPEDADLTALSALDAVPGLVTQTASDVYTKRTLTGDAEIVVTNGSGAAGNPTLSLAAAIARAAAVQPLDSDLTAIAALTTTSYGRAFLALADAAAGRTALSLGTAALSAATDFQPVDSDLTAIAALTTTSTGRSLLAAADAAAIRAISGSQASDTELTALAGLTSAADKLPYFTGSGTAALADLTTAGRALIDDASAAAQLTTLGAAALASPTFTGTPSLPTGTTGVTQSVGDSSTKLATTAFVAGAADIADTYANRPAASSSLNGIRFFATDKLMEWQCVAAAWVLINAYAPIVTALPSSPIDGQECKFQVDATSGTAGVNFHLRYNSTSSSTYKWEHVGGGQFFAEATNSVATTASYADPASGPSITLPAIAGDWNIEVGGELYSSVAGEYTYISYAVGGSASVDADGVRTRQGDAAAAGAATLITTSIRRKVKTAIAASTVIKLQIKGTGTNGVVNQRWLSIRPVRVG